MSAAVRRLYAACAVAGLADIFCRYANTDMAPGYLRGVSLIGLAGPVLAVRFRCAQRAGVGVFHRRLPRSIKAFVQLALIVFGSLDLLLPFTELPSRSPRG